MTSPVQVGNTPLTALIGRLPGPVLVLTELPVGPSDHGPAVTVASPGEPTPAGGWRSVLLVAADALALRRTAPLLSGLGRARTVAAWLATTDRAPALRLSPAWPPLREWRAEALAGGAGLVVLHFTAPVLAGEVLNQLAGQLAPVRGSGGVVVGYAGGRRELVSPADAGVRMLSGADTDEVIPPDLVLADRQLPTPRAEVTGRSPAVVVEPVPALRLGPVDDGLLNPIGFQRASLPGEQTLTAGQGRLSWAGPVAGLPADHIDPATVARLRAVPGVRVRFGEPEPRLAAAVAALAVAGVPLTAERPVPAATAELLGAELAGLLIEPADLTDPLAREEHSVRLRRAGLHTHGVVGWRRRQAADLGIRTAAPPRVSALLAIRRPEQLGFAVRQVARQRLRSGSLELVIAAHGFSPDPGLVAEAAGRLPVSVLELPADLVFGEVLARAAAAAGGDLLLKVDDDDWYGHDFIDDLLLARGYSGADLVGTPAEFVYLEPLGLTVRRRGETECFGRVVAGGTMLLDRGLLGSLGGFRAVTRFVDAQLLAAVRAAGGLTYRAHGLGYLLRRTTAGHTWTVPLDYFLARRRVAAQWRGFVPSSLLAVDPDDRPAR